MKRFWVVLILVTILVVTGTLARVPSAKSADSYDVLGKDQVILGVRAQVGGLDLVSRGQVIEQRLAVAINHPGVFDPANFRVVRYRTGVRVIFFRSQPLVTVTWQDARACDTTNPRKLAMIWLGNLYQELPKMTTYRLDWYTHNK